MHILIEPNIAGSRASGLPGCCVVIPAFDPSPVLARTVHDLRRAGFEHVVVVDDGSDNRTAPVFEQVRHAGATVLRHPQNRGKGVALKTGFAHALVHGHASVVTVDADGQHTASDAQRVAMRLLAEPVPACVLGVRSFDSRAPARSRFGNTLTRKIFGSLAALRVSDTQTGLRAFPASLLPELCAIPGDRYEYEMEMLVWLAGTRIRLVEQPIETIYVDGNAGSHFRPLIDSARIYWVLLRDVLLAVSSFLIDISLFSLFLALSDSILLSTYCARLLSGTYNFLGNRHFVFRTGGNRRLSREAAQYIALACLVATLSGIMVGQVQQFMQWSAVVSKMTVDLSMYCVSFILRKSVIFRPRRKQDGMAGE
ncbi:MAG: bifunctional glycosyltransferase family 2/GtrA family protein [Sterolibacteriaceae bacterium]|nr:bifunctional glycosyltransferase family 2/GtrA family protein [Candidatus Methylophosphatis haderslevensis]